MIPKLMPRQHWISDALRYFGWSDVDIAPGISPTEAWAAGALAAKISMDDLTRKVAAHFKLGVADIEAVDRKVLRLVPEKLARRYGVFPLSEDDRNLFVATSNPLDFAAERDLAFASGRVPVFQVAAPERIRAAIQRHYSPEKVIEEVLSKTDPEIAHAVRVLEDFEPELLGLGDTASTPIVRLCNMILRDAVRARASDIHIEPSRSVGAIRFRIDGVLKFYKELPIPALNRVVSRIKVLGKLDISDRMRPQDGRTRVHIEHQTYDLRISTVPTREAEKAVIRILNPDGARVLDDLAMAPQDIRRLRTLLSNREGIILVTGPTGSGKTTTLYAALRELADGKVNITTVEDPIEYELAGLTQMQAEPRQGMTFAVALRAILRQDPDVIFVGEIRDLETAQMAVQASMTGHLVLSTLHTNDAVSAISRLTDIGLDRISIAATLRGVISQRLIRTICSKCGNSAQSPAARGKGCEDCLQTGYYGRLPIQEILVMTPIIQEAISNGTSIPDLQQMALAADMRSLRSSALARVAAGETTLEEVDRVLGDTSEKSPPPRDRRASDSVRLVAVPDQPVKVPEQSHVLVVDDDSINRRIARSALEKQGYRVSEAADGMAALERIQEGGLSLVLLDLSMPRLNGGELLKKLRSSGEGSRVPIIVLTGSGDEMAEEQSMEDGADDYILKPLDPARLTARVRAVLRRSENSPKS